MHYCATSVKQNKLLSCTPAVHLEVFQYTSERPNIIVSLCVDKNKKQIYIFQFTDFIPVCLTMSCISYKIPQQSPYTPWQYKCSHSGKKNGCKMSPQWFKNKNKEMSGQI